jgi:eukaryotic-like serine/threonine-protein kinase
MIGKTLGHYQIVEKLGAGGMGEVYKGRDARLDRVVALKILRPDASRGADLRQRFEREARAIAALSHPHICTLFDVGRDGDTDFLVMEYCEGETLAQRLSKGPLPLEQALRYGTEIADALDKAHRAGIVHRDLKPGNIMITRSGVKLLDFGVAKLRPVSAAAGELPTRATAAEPLTAAGTILGTLHYMAPEQLEGKDADARADIFALGTVLHEMVTGSKTFEGSSAASVISAVMTAAPKTLASLQPLTPPALDQTVTACLAKDPEDRWQSAADVARHLRWIAKRPAVTEPRAEGVQRRGHARALFWAATAAILTFLIGAGLTYVLLKSPPRSMGVSRYKLALPADAPLAKPNDLVFGTDRTSLAISPDGRRVAYVAMSKGIRKLYVRSLDELDFRPLGGTEGASDPFFKPDGEWLGFYSEGKLRKVAFSGGSVGDICDVRFTFLGGSWHREGWILFSTSDGQIMRVTEGSAPQNVLPPERRKWLSNLLCLPRIQPDGESVLGTGINLGDSRLLSLGSGAIQTVCAFGGNPYLTATGHLVVSDAGVLRAAPFDATTKKVSQDAITVLPDLRTTAFWGAQYALSENGTLLYALGGATDEGRLVKVDRRDGTAEDLGVKPGIYQHVSMAADGHHVAVSMKDGPQIQVFTIDLRRPFLNPLSAEGNINNAPMWSPGADKIVYYSDRGAAPGLWIQSANGSSPPTPLHVDANEGIPTDWSRDDRFIVFMDSGPQKVLELGSKPLVRTLWAPKRSANWGVLSPDKRWLAYNSDDSGIGEIYIRAWPEVLAVEIRISTQGGGDPLWSRDGKELFYRNGDQFMAVPVPVSANAWVPKPALMFQKNYLNVQHRPWDVMDEQHFIMLQPTHPNPPVTELYLVENWFEELKRLVPVK